MISKSIHIVSQTHNSIECTYNKKRQLKVERIALNCSGSNTIKVYNIVDKLKTNIWKHHLLCNYEVHCGGATVIDAVKYNDY